MGTNEQLARAFLLAKLGRKPELTEMQTSSLPELATIATALVANLDGKPARVEWEHAALQRLEAK